jgi:hypothetical protein
MHHPLPMQNWCRQKNIRNCVSTKRQIAEVGRFFKQWVEGTWVSLRLGWVLYLQLLLLLLLIPVPLGWSSPPHVAPHTPLPLC